MKADPIACDAHILIGLEGSNRSAVMSDDHVKLTCGPSPRGNVFIEPTISKLSAGISLSIFLDPEDARALADALDRAADIADKQIDLLNERDLGKSGGSGDKS
jgi:hypothetical protein